MVRSSFAVLVWSLVFHRRSPPSNPNSTLRSCGAQIRSFWRCSTTTPPAAVLVNPRAPLRLPRCFLPRSASPPPRLSLAPRWQAPPRRQATNTHDQTLTKVSFSTSRGNADPKGPPPTRALSSARRLPRSKPPRKRQRQQTKRRDRSGPRPSYCAGERIANYKHATLQTTMHYIANRGKLLLSVNYYCEQTMANYHCGKPNMLLRTTLQTIVN